MRRTAIILAFTILFGAMWTPGQGKSVPDQSSTSRPRPRLRKAHSTRINCLPAGVTLGEAVVFGLPGARETVTVKKKLTEIKARCRNRKLIDGKGREIRFHRPSCWGNPPADYPEIQQRENEELQRLQQRYTVIVFGCNPLIQ